MSAPDPDATAVLEVPIEVMEEQFALTVEAGRFRLALLWRLMLMRERALKLTQAALAMPEAASPAKAQASDAQRSAMLQGADLVMGLSDQLDLHHSALRMSDEEAHKVLLVLDLGTADAFRAAAEMGWIGNAELAQASRSIAGQASAVTRGEKRDKVRAAYAELMKAHPDLKPKEAAFELHKLFPERSPLGLEATIRRWREAN